VDPGDQADPEVISPIASIRRDYEGVVMREDVPPEYLIKRGPFGEGRIEIRPGYGARSTHPIRLVGERKTALEDLVRQWMREGRVEDGRGEWSSPAFVVAKKGGKWRGVVDVRALNEATVPDNYPLPRIEDLLVEYGRKSMFTVLDLKDAFHQVPLEEASRPYTCTSTPLGTKQWRVVVMGLRNGVTIFQRVVEYCLSEVADISSAYVDDIIIATMAGATRFESLAIHDRAVRRVLEALRKHRLVADRNKCKFFVEEVE